MLKTHSGVNTDIFEEEVAVIPIHTVNLPEASSELWARGRQHINITLLYMQSASTYQLLLHQLHFLSYSLKKHDSSYRRHTFFSISSSSCLLQERHWWGLARDHAVLPERSEVCRGLGRHWEWVRQRFRLLLLCVLHFPLLIPGQCSSVIIIQ